MIQTNPIPYVSTKNYILSENSYVSYFKDDEFIKTIRYSSETDEPFELKKVEEANNIRLSYYKKWEDTISLIKE